MSDMEKMFSVLQAFRASENARKYLRYLDEIEEFIDDEFSESEYSDTIEQLRNFIVETNEALWRTYFREPADKEKCKDSCEIG